MSRFMEGCILICVLAIPVIYVLGMATILLFVVSSYIR